MWVPNGQTGTTVTFWGHRVAVLSHISQDCFLQIPGQVRACERSSWQCLRAEERQPPFTLALGSQEGCCSIFRVLFNLPSTKSGVYSWSKDSGADSSGYPHCGGHESRLGIGSSTHSLLLYLHSLLNTWSEDFNFQHQKPNPSNKPHNRSRCIWAGSPEVFGSLTKPDSPTEGLLKAGAGIRLHGATVRMEENGLK